MAAELVGVDADGLPGPTAGWVRMLMRELAPEFERLSESEDETAGQRVGFQFLLGATGADSRTRDPLIPFRTSNDEGCGGSCLAVLGRRALAGDTQRRCRDATSLDCMTRLLVPLDSYSKCNKPPDRTPQRS